MKFLLKPVPYVGLFLGVTWLMTSASLLTKDHPDSPSAEFLGDLEQTPCDELPQWVRVSDGFPYWPEAGAVYRVGDGKEENEKLLVPLLSKRAMASWPNISSDQRTGFLLEFSWDELQRDYPKVARAFSVETSEQQAADLLFTVERAPFPVSFKPVDSELAYGVLSEAEKMAVKDMKDAGFQEVVVVRPGSKPLTTDDGPALAFAGLLFTLGCGYWIYRRRKNRRRTAAPSAAAETGSRNGMDEALRSQVAAGVERAMDRHRQKQRSKSSPR